MTEQGRMRDRAIYFQKGSQPSVEILRRKGREGSSQSKEVAGALKFRKERDLQPNQELGDTQKQADELNLRGSAAGEGCRGMSQRWEQVFSLVPLSFSP